MLIDLANYDIKDIRLINVSNNSVNVDNNYNADELLPAKSTQSKVKESKVKESKVNKIILNYTKLNLLFDFLTNKTSKFENLTQIDKEIIINKLKKIDIFMPEISLNMPETILLQIKIQYWAITELYLSPYKIYLDKITRDNFLFRFLKTKQYIDYSTGTEESLRHFMGYFIKSLQDELKENKKNDGKNKL